MYMYIYIYTGTNRLTNTAGNVICQALVFSIPLHSALVMPSVGIFNSFAIGTQIIVWHTSHCLAYKSLPVGWLWVVGGTIYGKRWYCLFLPDR